MSKHEKSSPRAMPIETIITRFKSRQKLLEPEKNNTSKSVKINKKVNKKHKSKQIGTVTQEKKESDQKLKNNISEISLEKRSVKKIVLAPKHCYTLIGGLKSFNKRKLHTPRKEISFLNEEEKDGKEQEPDMLQLVEDCWSLDEEDLLEILTCPSPVWWEDPPDGYIEEPIFSSSQPEYEQKSIKTQLLEERSKEENQVTKVELSNKKVDDGSPLEISVVNRDSTFINKRTKLELLLGNIKNRKSVNRNARNKKKLKPKRKKGKNLKSKKKNKNDKRRDSLTLSDLGDDDILNHLENIDIPMYGDTRKDDDDNMTAEYLDMTLFDDEVDGMDKTKNDNAIAEAVEETNDDVLTNEVVVKGGVDKANDEIKDMSEVIDITNDDEPLISKVGDNHKVEEINDNNDLLTVYKVIDNDPDKLQIIIPKVDNYYKQMKKINKVDKSIMISEADAIRYCFVCSSIFDTDSCGYCDRKKEYSCDICGVKVNAKSEMIKHLHEHINGVSK